MKFSRPIRLKETHFKTATTATTKSTEHILLQQWFTQLLVPINSTEKRRLKGDLTAVHNYLLEWYGKDRARLFLEVSSEGWETIGKSCSKGNSNKILGKKESPWRWLSPRGGCSEKLWNLHHWRDPKFDCPGPVQPPLTGSVLTGGLDQKIFRDLLQPTWFYDSVQTHIRATVLKSFKYHIRECTIKGGTLPPSSNHCMYVKICNTITDTARSLNL